jgi:hypothetical protein
MPRGDASGGSRLLLHGASGVEEVSFGVCRRGIAFLSVEVHAKIFD